EQQMQPVGRAAHSSKGAQQATLEVQPPEQSQEEHHPGVGREPLILEPQHGKRSGSRLNLLSGKSHPGCLSVCIEDWSLDNPFFAPERHFCTSSSGLRSFSYATWGYSRVRSRRSLRG